MVKKRILIVIQRCTYTNIKSKFECGIKNYLRYIKRYLNLVLTRLRNKIKNGSYLRLITKKLQNLRMENLKIKNIHFG
jgi:hypothetical protein